MSSYTEKPLSFTSQTKKVKVVEHSVKLLPVREQEETISKGVFSAGRNTAKENGEQSNSN